MDVLKAILLVLLLPLVGIIVLFLAVAHEVSEFINDIYDDDMYWDGKD